MAAGSSDNCLTILQDFISFERTFKNLSELERAISLVVDTSSGDYGTIIARVEELVQDPAVDGFSYQQLDALVFEGGDVSTTENILAGLISTSLTFPSVGDVTEVNYTYTDTQT